MTSYFDDHDAQVSEAAATVMPDEIFLFFISHIEREIIAEVNLVTGDREFPSDLREKIQGIIAVHRTTAVGSLKATRRSIDAATLTRTCPLVAELHGAFHGVGRLRIQTRFGVLTDNPKVNLSMREDHDTEYKDNPFR